MYFSAPYIPIFPQMDSNDVLSKDKSLTQLQTSHAEINTCMKINEVIKNEQRRTCQIQQEQAIRPLIVRRRADSRNVAQIQQLPGLQKGPTKRQVSTQPIPDQLKHRLVQRRLTKQYMGQSNIIKPTTDDVRIAKNRAEMALKRADLDYQKRAYEFMRRQA
jgi:hypothetical protein